MTLVVSSVPRSLGHFCQLQHQVLLSNPFPFHLLPPGLTSICPLMLEELYFCGLFSIWGPHFPTPGGFSVQCPGTVNVSLPNNLDCSWQTFCVRPTHTHNNEHGHAPTVCSIPGLEPVPSPHYLITLHKGPTRWGLVSHFTDREAEAGSGEGT